MPTVPTCPPAEFPSITVDFTASSSANGCSDITHHEVYDTSTLAWSLLGTDHWGTDCYSGPPDGPDGCFCEGDIVSWSSDTIDCSCVGDGDAHGTFQAFYALAFRYGTIAGNTGWHVLLRAQSSLTTPSGSDCTISDVPRTNWFNAFLGATPTGTVTINPSDFFIPTNHTVTFTWVFS